MNRRLNFRLLAWTLGTLAVIAALVHALHLWQVDRNVTSLITYARQALADKKSGQALSLYDQYLKQVPTDLEALEEYGLALDQSARTAKQRHRVVNVLEGLLLKSADRPQARYRLIDNLAYLNQFDAAVRHIEMLLPIWEDKALLEHKRGWCLDAEGKHEAAAQAYRKAIALDPKRIESYALLAEVLHHRLARDSEAMQVLDQLVEKNPDNYRAYLVRFHYHRLLGRNAEADADLSEARRLAPREAAVLLASCQWAQSQGDFDEARRVAEEGLKLFPANESLIRESGNLELRQGNRAKALEVVESGLKAIENKSLTGELQVFHADLLIDAGRVAEAAEIIQLLRDEGMPSSLPNFLQARIHVSRKEWSKALGLLEAVRPALASDPFWNGRVNALMGMCLGQTGDSSRQIVALLDAARSEPRWPELTLSLGTAYLQAGNAEQAMVYLKRLETSGDAPEGTLVLLARAQLLATLQTPEKLRRWKEVDAAIAKAAKAGARPVDLVLLRAEVLQSQKKQHEARVVLLQELLKHKDHPLPEHLPLWVALAEMEFQLGHFERGEQVVAGAAKVLGDRMELRLALARGLALSGTQADRDRLKKLAEQADAAPLDDRARFHRELADLWQRIGEPAAAEAALRKVALDQPRDLRCRLALFELALQDQKLDQARQWLGEMRKVETPPQSQSVFAEALLRIEEAFGRPDILQKLLRDVKDGPLREEPDRLALVEARIYDRLDQPDLVAARLLDAVQNGQRSPRIIQRLVLLLVDRQQYDQADWALSLLDARVAMSPELTRAAVEVALMNQNKERVRGLLGVVTIETVRDYRDLLWLARVYRGIDDAARAEASLRRAVAVAPHAPDVWAGLIGYLVQSGRRADADKVAEEMSYKVAGKRAPYLLARAYEALGDFARAEASLKKAIEARPDDFTTLLWAADFYRQADHLEQAGALYHKVLDPTLAVPAEILTRARRGLALTLAASDPSKARDLLKENQDRKDPVDARISLFLQGMQPGGASAAIRQYEELLTRSSASPEDLFQLARLYEKDGKGDSSRARMNQVVTEKKDTPQMLAFYAHSLLQNKDLETAARIVERLEMREPSSTRTKALRKRLDFAKKAA